MAGREKTPLSGSTSMLVLALLNEREMYGYEIIEELERRSNHVFKLKEGTLYPILHALEKERCLAARAVLPDHGEGAAGPGGEERGVEGLLRRGDGNSGRRVRGAAR